MAIAPQERSTCSGSDPAHGAVGNPAQQGSGDRDQDCGVTWRSIAIGILGVAILSVFAPFNDWVLLNTPLIGNFLPVGVLILLLSLLVLVQVPLRRFAPRHAIGRGELALVLAMWLVGCAMPTSGFMRYVPATLISIHAQAAESADLAAVVDDAHLPSWLLPAFDSSDAASRGREPVVTEYVSRAHGERQHWSDYLFAVPWSRWATPAIAWGAFAVGLFGMGLLIPLILQRQWVENERLPFPLAAVYLSLIEPPATGRVLNSLFRSRGFWLAAGAVFGIHLWNGFAVYAPQYVPAIPTGFYLNPILADPPLNQLEWYVKQSKVFFSVIGITFFLQSNVSFSLWSFVVILQVAVVYLGLQNAELTAPMRLDQSTGAILAVAATILFTARRHLMVVFRQMIRGVRADEPKGEFISYAASGWLFVLCAALVVGWVTAIGLSRPDLTWANGMWSVATGCLVAGAAATVFIVMYRVVAETGLPFVQLAFMPTRLFVYLQQLSSATFRVDQASYLHSAWLSQNVLQDQRESLAPFAGQALRVLDASGSAQQPQSNGAWRVGALVLSLVTAFIVSGAAMLLVEYNFSATASTTSTSEILNRWVMVDSTRGMLGDVQGFFSGSGRPQHNVWMHLALGIGVTLLLSGGRMRFSWWPIYPIGFLLMHTYAMQMCWFSIFIGWLVKTTIVRFGGAGMLRDLRPLFIGLIVGEACAAGFWLLSGATLYALGVDFQIVRLLPA